MPYTYVSLENNKNKLVDFNIIHKYVTNTQKQGKTIWTLL